jgi:uncharacterized protein
MIVDSIWRYPVKSMAGERLADTQVVGGGLIGDRAYALIDVAQGRVASAKLPRKWGMLLAARAAYASSPAAARDVPAVRIRFPDGTQSTSDDPDIDDALSALAGAQIRITTSRPSRVSVERLDPLAVGEVIADIGALMPEGRFADYAPLHLVTTATLAELKRLNPLSDFDARRFRPNLVIDTGPAAGAFIEQGWIGKSLKIGGVEARISDPTPRCSVPTLAQAELPQDREILRTLVQHNRVPVDLLGGELLPCAGVYAFVTREGRIEVGDEVGPL